MIVFSHGDQMVKFHDVTQGRTIVHALGVSQLLYITPPEAHALPHAQHWCIFNKKASNIDFDAARAFPDPVEIKNMTF